jgi:hypothetical protein
MRKEVIASGLASSKPQRIRRAASSLESTPRIGHVVRRYRSDTLIRAAKSAESLSFDGRSEENEQSGFDLQNEAVDRQTEATQEKQGRKEIDNRGLNGNRNLQRLGIPGGKVIDYPGQQHVQESATNLRAPGAARGARQAHLRDHFAAKRTLVQVRGDLLSAKRALPHVHGVMSDSAHEFRKKRPPFQARWRDGGGQGECDEHANREGKPSARCLLVNNALPSGILAEPICAKKLPSLGI